MPTFKNILFPTDFSERSIKALGDVVDICKWLNAKLLIYHAYSRPFNKGSSKEISDGQLRALERRIDEKFKALDQDYKLRTVDHEFRKELGASVDNILKTCENEPIDLIISTTRGAHGFGELWGTKTSEIIKGVDIPVLVIPFSASIGKISKIGLACDYSSHTKFEALHPLVAFAEQLETAVDLISFNHFEKDMSLKQLENRSMIRTELENIPAAFTYYFNQNIEEGLIDYCKSNNIDVLSLLPKSHSFIENLFHESLTKKMVFHSPIPLMILK